MKCPCDALPEPGLSLGPSGATLEARSRRWRGRAVLQVLEWLLTNSDTRHVRNTALVVGSV